MFVDLEKCSIKNKMGLNISESILSDFTPDMVFSLYEDVIILNEKAKILDGKYNYRVKSFGSIVMNMATRQNVYDKLYDLFSDIVALRIIVEEYPENLQGGGIVKSEFKDDNGYRAYHVDYQLSTYHYPIEIQYWLYSDELFNTLSRKYLYKTSYNWVGSVLRYVYDLGVIKSEADFMFYLAYLKENDWNKEILWSYAVKAMKSTMI